MALKLICADLTKLKVDAVVNAANSRLAPGGGVCGAIFAAAGYEQLERSCRAIGGCETGCAVLTEGFLLPAKYIIHTVGPIWRGGGNGEEELLKNCYRSTLVLARENGCNSIAFPLISSGIYGYPKIEALKIAVNSIQAYLEEHDIAVYLTLFDPEIVSHARGLFSDMCGDGL